MPVTELDRTYWAVGFAASTLAERHLFVTEEAARSAARVYGYDVLERLDADGTTTTLDLRH